MKLNNSKKIIFNLLIFIFLTQSNNLVGQDWAKTNIKNLQRVDLHSLGYYKVNEIPENNSAITSLLTAKDGKIYGGTSGDEAYLFMFDPETNKVRHLGKISNEESIHHSLVEDNNGYIYIGTGKNMFEEIILSEGGIGKEGALDKSLWNDLKEYYRNYAGGQLLRYNPEISNDIVKLPDMECDTETLGIPLANNAIYAMTINPSGDEIYGITYPDGHFFIYQIEDSKFIDMGTIDEKIVFHGPERYWRSLSRDLVCDDSGRVFFSSTEGIIKYYCPITKKIIKTNMKIPGDYYYIQFFEDYSVVEYFAKSPSGLIYGGTSDGHLFSIDSENMKLINLGKVRSSRRLRCLTVAKNEKIYLMAGERSASRPCQFYSYDPREGGFEDLGLLIVDKSPHYYWRGQQFDAMTTGKEGTIYLGESERKSHLFQYIP
ncbi:MAG: hypothetical protein PHQ92_02365 [Petrimonas sp.]|jgi:outer membrane protein assembly factor BamB|nr:hypothetical protein [Petrimonas sp.]